MSNSKVLKSIIKNDYKLIRRDLVLVSLLGFVVYIAVILKFLLPWANNVLVRSGLLPGANISKSLSDFYPIIIYFLIVYTGAMLSGAILGFLFLSEKDDNTIMAMLVTPISPKRYINYRIILTALISFAIIMFQFYVVNIGMLPFWKMAIISIGGSLLGPIIMLFFAVFAESKMQGLAYGKFLSLGGIIIIISWFIKEPVQYVFGLLPPYWIGKAYWLALDNNWFWLVALLLGMVLQLVMIRVLTGKYQKSIFKSY